MGESDVVHRPAGQVTPNEAEELASLLDAISDEFVPPLRDRCGCAYVSTIAVRLSRRRAGLARRLYEALFSLPDDLPDWVVLRTWSTNAGHIPLLRSLGFVRLLTQVDHRGVGIDTIYFGRTHGS